MRPPLVLACVLLLAGCGEVLETDYGLEKPGSVDSCSVLVSRLEERTRLRRASLLSPRLSDGCDLVVHLARDPGLPSDEACTWLRSWLEAEDGRQAVLILRGDSPAPQLCRRWAAEARSEGLRVGGATGEELLALSGRFARAATLTEPPAWPKAATGGELRCPLFVVRMHETLQPDYWAVADGWPQAAPDTLRLALLPSGLVEGTETLISARSQAAADRPWSIAIPFGGSRLVIAANASPLLDGALPDPQARALLAAWLDEIVGWHDHDGLPACAWVGSLRVRDGEPEAANPMALVFTRWPLALASWHLLALAALWLAARAWWLGRREASGDGRTASFGAHVDALAGQLAAERHHQAAARAIARASGLPAPPTLRDADAARAWLRDHARENIEEHR